MHKYLPFFLLLLPILAWAQPQEANLLGTWSDETLVGSTQYNNTYNEIWGYAINGKEYAIAGSTAGTHFIDVTDPENPYEAFFVAGAATGGQIVHRDYHDYKGYLYAACGEGASTLQIIDMNQLPYGVNVVYDSDEQFRRAHNIFIDTAQAKLYTFATGGGIGTHYALRIYDISNPVAPTYVSSFNTFGTYTVGHVHDGYIRNGLAFLNCGGDGFVAVDFSDPINPIALTVLNPGGYNHSGWTTDDCNYYYMAAETHGMDMMVMDVSDPCESEIIGTFDADSPIDHISIPHNQIVACNYLYTSYYYDGLQVYDISDPTNPQRVLYYNTSTLSHVDGGYEGAWGVYPLLPSGNILIFDMQEGLFILEGMGDNCAATQELTSCDISCGNISATNEIEKISEFTIQPNPATTELNVNISLIEGQYSVNPQLLDITGQVVQRFDIVELIPGENKMQLNLDRKLPAGFYLFQIGNAELNLVKKVVLE